MKEGWEYKKLGEIATEMYRGSGIKRDQVTKEGTPCVRYGEIYTTYNISFDTCVSHTNIESITSPKYFEHGDLLFAITGESVEDIGKTIAYLGDEKCLCGGDIICMKHRQNPKYLAYALSTPDAIRQKGIGKTKLKVVHTNAPALKAISIPLAPLPEQQSIVDYLDSAFAKIDAMKANAEKALSEAKALFQASLKEMLEPKEGWEETTLEDLVVSNVVGLTRGKVEQGYDKQYPYFKMNNISPDNTLCWDDLICVDANKEELEKYSLQEGDFLFNTRNSKEWVGKSTVYRNYYTPVMLYNNNIMRIRFVDTINSVFVAYSFLADYTKDQLEKIKSGTTNVWAIYYRDLSKIILSYPSVTEQQSIVETLDSLKSKVDRLQENYNKISLECDALKQAILRQVFE